MDYAVSGHNSIHTLLQERRGKQVRAVHQMGWVALNKNRFPDTFSRVFFLNLEIEILCKQIVY